MAVRCASVSFGAERFITFRDRAGVEADVNVLLRDRSLLVMMGDTQKNWYHGITTNYKYMMRNWIDIVETQSTGDTSRLMKVTFEEIVKQHELFTVVGDWDAGEYFLSRFENKFLLKKDNTFVAYYFVNFGEYAEIVHAYVIPDYRGQKLTEKFCWFLQTREGYKIMFGQHMSPDARKLIDSLYASKRFKLFWIKDDEKEAYRPNEQPEHDSNGDAIGHYALDAPTGWHLIAENEKVRLPHFNENQSSILAETYSLFDHYELT